MKNRENKSGFTLVEMVVVVGVIVLLTSMIIAVATRVDNQAKEQTMENTMAILNGAIEQFGDYRYEYKHSNYTDLDFPLDCNGFDTDDLQTTLEYALGATEVSISSDHNPNYSGSEILYFFLSRIPENQKTLRKIVPSLIRDSSDSAGNKMIVTVDGKEYQLLRFIDPWGETLHYDYYDETATTIEDMLLSRRTFPIITSAGPDRIFGTPDDITSR